AGSGRAGLAGRPRRLRHPGHGRRRRTLRLARANAARARWRGGPVPWPPRPRQPAVAPVRRGQCHAGAARPAFVRVAELVSRPRGLGADLELRRRARVRPGPRVRRRRAAVHAGGGIEREVRVRSRQRLALPGRGTRHRARAARHRRLRARGKPRGAQVQAQPAPPGGEGRTCRRGAGGTARSRCPRHRRADARPPRPPQGVGMNLDLAGRHALVCGASEGIGRAAAMELALLGARVTVLARRAAVLEELAAALPCPTGQRHGALAVDVGDTGSLSAAVRQLASEAPVQVLVNNTGGPPGGPVHGADAEAFLDAFRKHLLANQALVQALLPGMRAAGYGRIINVISTSVKEPIAGLGVSNTIRGAVASWAKTLAGEL